MATATRSNPIQNPRVVPHEQWLTERAAFMAKEKEFTRLRDELSRQRRELPWEKVTKSYVFDGPRGKETLADLFEGRSQLVVYHFMFDPAWDEACKSCSFWADNFNGIDVHLAHRDITFLAISRAPLAKLEAFKKRMGWSFKWVSVVRERLQLRLQGVVRRGGREERRGLLQLRYRPPQSARRCPVSACSTRTGTATSTTPTRPTQRGIDLLNGAYNYIDLTPKGRDEGTQIMSWLRRHDQYED